MDFIRIQNINFFVISNFRVTANSFIIELKLDL